MLRLYINNKCKTSNKNMTINSEKYRFKYVQKINYFCKNSTISTNSNDAGFSLLELLVVILIVGILSAIAAPSWLNFLNQRRATAVHEAVWGAIREAQSRAKTEKVNYSMSFRNENDLPEIIVFKTDELGGDDFPEWKGVGNNVDLKPRQIELSSNIATTKSINGTNYQTITFDEIGALTDFDSDEDAFEVEDNDDVAEGISITAVALNRQGEGIDSTQRCVKVLTLLGLMIRSQGADCQ